MTHTLPRTGLPALEFSGRLLAEATSAQEHSFRRHRHHILRLYETERGQRVVHVAYRSVPSRTNCSAEPGCDWAEVCESSAVPEVLADYDPLEDVTGGYPPLERFKEQQARMKQAIADGYDEAVSALLAAAGYVERI